MSGAAPRLSVIGLDLSSNAGFAHWRGPGFGDPTFGFWPLPQYSADPSRQLAALRNVLSDWIEELQADGALTHMVLEYRPPAGGGAFAGRSSANSQDQQVQLEAIARLIQFDYGLELVSVHPRTVRSVLLGVGNGNMTKKEKEGGLIVRWLQAEGYSVFDHNAADALMLVKWFFKRDWKRPRVSRAKVSGAA